MTTEPLSPAMIRFIDYFGELGPRWGLPRDACRVHALLYLLAGPATEAELAAALVIAQAETAEAVAFLAEHHMVRRAGIEGWISGADPWEMLTRGLQERGRRELPGALETLRHCSEDARIQGVDRPAVWRRINAMLGLAEDLSAIGGQAHRLSPQLMRGLVGVSGRAARLIDRAFGQARGERP